MSNTNIEQLTDFLLNLVEQGGPHVSEYDALSNCYQQFHGLLHTDQLQNDDLRIIWQRLGEPFTSTKTNQGFAINRPHGYAGDFEIIDRIYTHWISPDENLERWDNFFHAQSAAKAVRNRKRYFIDTLASKLESSSKPIDVLNVASGPARDLAELYAQHPNDHMRVDCVEYDVNAIAYAKNLTKDWSEQINFIHANALKFDTEKRYDLIWSAGLFDYLDEPTFRSLLSRLYAMLKPDGELIIGNISVNNPTQPFMVFVCWNLHLRNEDMLSHLATTAGIEDSKTTVASEIERVNLFLHLLR